MCASPIVPSPLATIFPPNAPSSLRWCRVGHRFKSHLLDALRGVQHLRVVSAGMPCCRNRRGMAGSGCEKLSSSALLFDTRHGRHAGGNCVCTACIASCIQYVSQYGNDNGGLWKQRHGHACCRGRNAVPQTGQVVPGLPSKVLSRHGRLLRQMFPTSPSAH
jgi:hypothetical protein